MEPIQEQGQEVQPVREYRVQPAHNVYAFAAVVCTAMVCLTALVIACIGAYVLS